MAETRTGRGAGYPTTLWTLVLEARDRGDPDYGERLGALVERYWKPVYWTLRRRWKKPDADARDLTQAFFTSFLERDRLAPVERERGRFRTYLRVLLDNFMRNELAAARAAKRGGGRVLSLEGFAEPPPLTSPALGPEQVFDRLWAESVFRDAQAALRAELSAAGQAASYEAFARHALADAPPTYEALGHDLGLTVHQVQRALKRARAAFARHLRALVRETLAEGETLDEELRYLAQALRW